MGKKRKRNADKSADDAGLASAVAALLAQAMDDPAVARCTLSIDKVTGLARLSTSGTDGRTATHDILGPGLAQATRELAATNQQPGYSGAQARAARDAQILALAARGLTQTETARVLGISQALVSKILRAGQPAPA